MEEEVKEVWYLGSRLSGMNEAKKTQYCTILQDRTEFFKKMKPISLRLIKLQNNFLNL